MKLYSVRVEPNVAKEVHRWACNHSLKVERVNVPGDTFITFQGSKASVDRVNAFLDGWNAKGPNLADVFRKENERRKAENERGKCKHVSQLESGADYDAFRQPGGEFGQ